MTASYKLILRLTITLSVGLSLSLSAHSDDQDVWAAYLRKVMAGHSQDGSSSAAQATATPAASEGSEVPAQDSGTDNSPVSPGNDTRDAKIAPVAGAGAYVSSNTDSTVNLRASPNGRIVGALKPGQAIKLSSGASRGGWIPVLYNGHKVYVFNSLVNISDDPNRPVPSSPANSTAGTIDSNRGANLRSSPNGSSDVIAVIPDDTEISVTGPSRNGWTPVFINGRNGFVSSKLIATDAKTDAVSGCPDGHCNDSHNNNAAPQISAVDILNHAQASSFASRWTAAAWRAAIKGRYAANFRGGAWISGNASKGMCSAAVQEALFNAGLCTKLLYGNAITLYTDHKIDRYCPALKLDHSLRNPATAPGFSLIVYSGYAGSTPHHYGHIEAKIQVTSALHKALKGDPRVGAVPVGQYIYCSDFCSPRPTIHRDSRGRITNPLAAIYTLK